MTAAGVEPEPMASWAAAGPLDLGDVAEDVCPDCGWCWGRHRPALNLAGVLVAPACPRRAGGS